MRLPSRIAVILMTIYAVAVILNFVLMTSLIGMINSFITFTSVLSSFAKEAPNPVRNDVPHEGSAVNADEEYTFPPSVANESSILWHDDESKKPLRWPTGHRRGRFPTHGTDDFEKQCAWTAPAYRKEPECTFLVRPGPNDQEGMANWVSYVTKGYLLARQAECRLLLDYGPKVDLGQILRPAQDLIAGHDEWLHNWAVPADFECVPEEHCYLIGQTGIGRNVFNKSIPGRDLFAPVPFYRFAYGTEHFYDDMFNDLEKALPGFHVESGMACSLGKIFHLSPTASQFEPGLFTDIIPRLRDEETLVLSVYIRTGFTESGGNITSEQKMEQRESAIKSLDCTISLERQYLSGKLGQDIDFSTVVWMLVTDSPYVKEWVVTSYEKQDVNVLLPMNGRRWENRSISRQILTTGSRGAHTRMKGNPSTRTFAEALIDWYLIGESDVVVPHKGWSFGMTGAMRTSRPVYKPFLKCSRGVMVHKRKKQQS